MDLTTAAIAATATLLTAIVGGFVKLLRLRPDTATVFVKSAESLVVTQGNVLENLERQYRETNEKVVALQSELSAMHLDLASLTQSREEAREEARMARSEVKRLRSRVRLLEDHLRENSITIPEYPDDEEAE